VYNIKKKGKLGIIGLGPNLGFHETFPHSEGFFSVITTSSPMRMRIHHGRINPSSMEYTLFLGEGDKGDGYQSSSYQLIEAGR
jgi:hypothetical protein